MRRTVPTPTPISHAESLERLDATSRSLARDLMRAKLLKAFSPEEWDEAHRLISRLPAERGGIGPRKLSAAAATSAFAEKSAAPSPAIGSLAWAKAWVEYFSWLTRRRAAIAFAFASRHAGFDGFKYLWGAPAAAAVIGAFFGIVLLDEHLGLRRILISSPPVQWIAELVGVESSGDEEQTMADTGPILLAKSDGSRAPATTITQQHAKGFTPGQEVVLQSVAKPEPAAASERFEASLSRQWPKTASISRERPDQQFVPRPIPVLGDAVDGDSGGGGPQSGSETTSEKSSVGKAHKPETNSIPKIADNEPDSPKTNSGVTAPKRVKQTLKKVEPAAKNAKRDENRMLKSSEESTPERVGTSTPGAGLEEHNPIAGIVDRLERTPEWPENKVSETNGSKKTQHKEIALETERVGITEPAQSPRPSGRVEGATAKVERVLVKAVERIERVEQVQRPELGRPERVERVERVERPELRRPERVERVERVERPERAHKIERPEKLERIERKLVERIERGLRPERR